MPTILHGGLTGVATIAHAPLLATGVQTVVQPETVQVHEQTIAKVGDLVQKIPTAVSDQRSTVVHNQADLITPVVAPAIRTNTVQVLKAYSQPVVYTAAVHATPILRAIRD